MSDCNCLMMARSELKDLIRSDRSAERDEAVGCLVSLLTASDEPTRRRGYELFKQGMGEALFCSCLNYGSLTGGFTDPLIDVVTRVVEFWATADRIDGPRAHRPEATSQP